jgi:hypothetical protein
VPRQAHGRARIEVFKILYIIVLRVDPRAAKLPDMQDNGTTSGSTTAGNRDKLAQLKNGWADLLTQAMQRGFYGNVAIELAVQDGTIQQIRQRVERIER